MIISKKNYYKLVAVIAAFQFTSTAFAVDGKATISASIIGPTNSVGTDISTTLTSDVAANSWAQLLYSESPGVLIFTIPGSGSLTASHRNPCICRLTGSPAQIAAQISCNDTNSRTCASSVNKEQLATLMACSGTENNQDFCACEIVGSVEQIAALLFCNGTLSGSKAISLMVTSKDDVAGKLAVITVAYN